MDTPQFHIELSKNLNIISTATNCIEMLRKFNDHGDSPKGQQIYSMTNKLLKITEQSVNEVHKQIITPEK